MNIPLILKNHEVLGQEILKKLIIRYRFAGIESLALKTTEKRFRRQLSPNEAHSYADLVKHMEFEVSKKE